MRALSAAWGAGLLLVAALPLAAAPEGGIARTESGHPDLSGTYDIATITPLQRPEKLADQLYLTPEEVAALEQAERDFNANPPNEGGGKDRGAPPTGGDGSTGAEGNVGGYNRFWTDRGTEIFQIDGKYRTSILIDPPNGRLPALTEAARERGRSRGPFHANDGTAWWLGYDGPGPYDDPERRPLGERCLLGFGSTQGPPMLPVLYNNLKRIVQTDDHIVIVVEMIHDARIVRLDSQHPPADVRKWLGDSIGWWEGDTLVVETTGFRDTPGFSRGSASMKVTERFTPIEGGDLLYGFTVEDPSVWTAPFSGEYRWPRTNGRVYEYACHEGNYALGNILRGARMLEATDPPDTGGAAR